jgi:hypothetical protein
MKRKRQRRSTNPLYSLAILTIIFLLPLLLFYTSNDDDHGIHQRQVLQNALAAGMTTNPTATTTPTSPPGANTATGATITSSSNLPNKPVNNTGQAAATQTESLVRSIMDPASMITSVLNQTGGSKTHSTNTTNQSNGIGGNHSATALGNTMQNGVVRNIYTLLLAHQIIPPKDFIPLYDTSPYQILNGHLAAKIPCDANSVPSLQILVGHLPDVKPVQLQVVKGFSQPGNICLYHVDLGSATTTAIPPSSSTATTAHDNNSAAAVNTAASGRLLQANETATINTDLVLNNPTADRVILPNTSTVVIGVDEIMPLDNMLSANTNNNNHSAAPLPHLTSTSSTNNNSNNTNITPGQSRGGNGQINNLINAMTASLNSNNNNNKPITR